MDVDALAAFADEALAGLAHRQLDFEPLDVGDRMRGSLDRRGWKTTRVLWLLHRGVAPERVDLAIEEVAYDAVHDLRKAWLREDFPDVDPAAFLAQERELARRFETRVLAVVEDGTPIAFSQLLRDRSDADITSVFVAPDHRGQGIGTALTIAAIEAAGTTGDLWIVADDDARAKDLYMRLGFRPVWRMMEATLLPAVERRGQSS